jgi:hypothetical protein
LDPKIARPDHPAITELSLLRLNTFGRLFVQRDGQRLGGAAAQPRRLALLAVLAASRDRGVTRDRLLAMLWPEAEDERARKGLNQALYALRQELGADEVLLGAQDLRLNPELITSDVSLFTAALEADRLEPAGPLRGRSSPPTGSGCTSRWRSGRATSGRWFWAGKATPDRRRREGGGP